MKEEMSVALIKSLVNIEGKSIAQKELEEILNRDIHENSLGCKISNTHVRIGKVHLDTFYEAQLLFGNAYWSDVFAYYFYKFILHKLCEIKHSKKKPIILYGYETYSTLTLNKTIAFLENEGYKPYLRIYEVKNSRVRYCENATAEKNILEKDPAIFFFVGVSSTLSTFNHMNDALIDKVDKAYENVAKKFCTSIVQVIGNVENKDVKDASVGFIKVGKDDFGKYVECISDDKYLEFAYNGEQKSYYYVSVKSTWYFSESCALCMPSSNFINEYPLIEVNEASVVPTQMIRLNKSKKRTEIEDPIEKLTITTTRAFLDDIDNDKYLYGGHIERNNNHFKYYLRLSRLYFDKKLDIEKWLKKVKKYYKFSTEKTINIIVAPQHYSNTGFINSVNNIIFDGAAHIMGFDIQKEYRSNFKAKYSNYSEIESIVKDLKDFTIKFYYVNDQIVSGASYYRAKSLIRSLFNSIGTNIDIFSGVFVLLNQNSLETRMNYVNTVKTGSEKSFLPYFSYLNLDMPSLRNYDDSCPMCYNRNKFFEIIEKSILDSTILHWQKKIINYTKLSVTEIRENKESIRRGETDFIKLQCENDLWISIKKAYVQIEKTNNTKNKTENFNRDIIIKTIYECIGFRINALTDMKLKVEYLIAYIKIISQALLYYQEDVKKATIFILLKLFNYFLTNFDNNETGPKSVDKLPIGNYFLYLNIEDESLIYDLFRVVVSRLCSVGSSVLLNKERLQLCRKIGQALQEKAKFPQESFDDFLLNSIKKLLCYDKGVSKAIVLGDLLKNLSSNTAKDDMIVKLLIENFDDPNISKRQQTIDDIKKLNKIDVNSRYEKLVTILKNECEKSSRETLEIEIYTPKEEAENTVVNIKNGKTQYVEYKKDFYYYNDTYYVRIGNNYNELKEHISKLKLDKILESELKIIKNAIIILGIKTQNIYDLTRILRYRKEIMEIVQTDFNNDAILKLIMAQDQAKVLSEIKTVTHNQRPLQEFARVFEELCETKVSLNLQRKFLTLYMDTIISIAYKELLKFRKYKLSSIDLENSMFELGYNCLGEKLDYAEKQIKDQYGQKINLSFGLIKDNIFVAFDTKLQKEIKNFLKEKSKILRFHSSNNLCDCYMIIKTLIDNAMNHSTNPTIEVRFLKNSKNNYDLCVFNTINQLKSSPSDKGITLDALEYIFTVKDCQPFLKREIIDNSHFVFIKNFIILE